VPHNSPASVGANAAATANKHVSWVDVHASTDPKGPFHAVSSFPAGHHAGQSSLLWGHSSLLSVSSAPALGCAGDLRDQGRISWGGVSGEVMGGAAGFNPLLGHALEAHEEVSTPMEVRGKEQVIKPSGVALVLYPLYLCYCYHAQHTCAACGIWLPLKSTAADGQSQMSASTDQRSKQNVLQPSLAQCDSLRSVCCRRVTGRPPIAYSILRSCNQLCIAHLLLQHTVAPL
jgi:hypothetical protein